MYPDYNVLFAFNFGSVAIGTPAHMPRDPISPQEAIRYIIMHLEVTKVEPPGPEDNQALPVVHFKGTSHVLHSFFDPNANSNLRGQW